LIVLAKRSAYAFEIWRPRRQPERLDSGHSQRVTKRVAEAWIAIMKEEAFPWQASINRIGELATALDHPGTVKRVNPPAVARGNHEERAGSRLCFRHLDLKVLDIVRAGA
jgi:hypothetical protein